MAIFNCPSCEHSQSVSDEHIGKVARCPNCGSRGPVLDEADAQPDEALSPQFADMIVAEALDREPIIRRSSGGSIRTDLGHGIVLNKQSTLQREWITIIDPNFPVTLVGEVGIETKYRSGTQYQSGGYYYFAEYAIRCREPITACEIRFLTFDLWGTHDRTLSSTEIQDIKPDVTHRFTGEWNLFYENEACEFYASIAFVRRIRTASGRVLIADPSTALREAQKFSEKFSESDLEPTKVQK